MPSSLPDRKETHFVLWRRKGDGVLLARGCEIDHGRVRPSSAPNRRQGISP